jgi:hypothetical protein
LECTDGTKYIVFDHFVYTRTLQYNSKDAGWYSNWRCAIKGCRAKAVIKSTNPNFVELNDIKHNHEIDAYKSVLTIETDVKESKNKSSH